MSTFSLSQLPERIARRITVTPEGCWSWGGHVSRGGYARAYWEQQPRDLHRAIYAALVGDPGAAQLDHQCHDRDQCPGGTDCPHRRCVNPGHLEPSTVRENVLRGVGFSADNARLTHCRRGGHPLSGANLYVNPKGQRECRTCRAAANARHDARRRAR